MENANRDAVARAAAVYDEIEGRMADLQRRLDESLAHQKAQAQLIDELRLELGESRSSLSTYRADAETARADTVGIMSCLANVKDMLDAFQIPSERLPMRRKRNGKASDAQVTATADNPTTFDELAGKIGELAKQSQAD